MSLKVKAWINSIRKTTSSSFESDIDCNDNDKICPFENIASDILQYILSFLDYKKLHEIRLIGKEWNYLCDIEQKILRLNIKTTTKYIKYWMLKLRNIQIIDLSHNNNINNQFLIWLKKDYLPLRIGDNGHKVNINININIHFDLSFCFGIDCVEEPQLYGRGGVNGHNDYLKKLMNKYTQNGVTFNIFGNYRIINPSKSLNPRHVVLLQLYSLKYNEIQHCFKFASPANRQFTGPLPRFQRMITNAYPTMINWDNSNIVNTPISCIDKKHYIVTIIKKNKKEKFKWTLSKQKIKPYIQCWMTDSVSSLCSH